MGAADPRIDAVRRYSVPVIALNSLGLTDVSAMKVDAEGAEEEVLRGAITTLRRCRPVLSVEIKERHRPGSLRRVPELLNKLGYAGFYVQGKWRSIDGFHPALLQRASPSPASFDVSDPYIFCFYFCDARASGRTGTYSVGRPGRHVRATQPPPQPPSRGPPPSPSRQARAIFPVRCRSERSSVRCPCTFLPYIDFSTHTPYASATALVSSEASGKFRSYLAANFSIGFIGSGETPITSSAESARVAAAPPERRRPPWCSPGVSAFG